MAEQSTVATAYNQLRPLENTNLGAIVEEHIRYYKKQKDDQDAAEKAAKAQQAKFMAARNKEAVDLYDGIQPTESEGYLNAQIISAFERNKDNYKDLARAYANGDLDAGLQLKEIKKKYENLVLTNTAYSKKAQERANLKKEGIYNEYLDAETDAFGNAIAKSLFKINDDLSVDVYDPSQKEVTKLPNGALLNNTYLQSSYHPPAKFTENGKALAQNLLDNNDGNKIETPDTRLEGIRLVQGLFAQDDVELRSFVANTRKNEVLDAQGNVVKFNTKDGRPMTLQEIGESPVMMTKLSSLYYDNYVRPNLQEVTVDNRLDDALKAERLKALREANANVQMNLRTDENGNPVRDITWKGKQLKLRDGTLVFGFDSKAPKEVVNKKGEKVQPTNILYDPKNNAISVLGSAVREEVVDATTEDGRVLYKTDTSGNAVLDAEGNPIPQKTIIKKVIGDASVEDDVTVGNVITQVENPATGKKFKDIAEAKKYYQEIAPQQTTNNTPKFN